MKFNLKPLQAALLLAGLSPLAAQALVLPLIADTHLAVTNAGTSVAVNVNANNKALLNFDLSTLPAGITSADIAKATLVFFVKTVPTGGQLQVSPLTSAWTENATISTSPSTGLPQATSAPISKGNTYFAIDVTNLVLNWIDVPASNNGLALDPLGQTSLTFDSKEAIQTSHPAYIEIALKGPAGAVGHVGAIGPQGPQGVPGISGSNGLNGAPGVNGLDGAKGAAGANGVTGVKGDTGLTGAVGPTGGQGMIYHWGDRGPDGGIVYYVDGSGQHGLEAQASDASAGAIMNWDTAISSSAAYNTTFITRALGCSQTAAPSTPNCWHLPSRTELEYLHEQKAVVGGFAYGYWSSTETNGDAGSAWFQYDWGGQNYNNKYGSLFVRAVRAF